MMSRFTRPGDPRHVPEFTLWTMCKGSRIREARTRLLPIGDSIFEFGVYEVQTDGTRDLQWSMAYLTSDKVNELAQRSEREHEADGWTAVCAQCNGTGWTCQLHAGSAFEHQLADASGHCSGARLPCSCDVGAQLASALHGRNFRGKGWSTPRSKKKAD